MRRVWLSLLVVLWALPAVAVTVRTGTGRPSLEGWCELGWGAGRAVGHGGLTDRGLLLSAAQVPPVPAYELTLRLIPHTTLLFVFESPEPAGKIRVSLDCQLVSTVSVPTKGTWWMEISDLPDAGILGIELGPCCEQLLIRGIYAPCEVCPSCLPWLVVGLLAGALLMWLVLR
ncbi:MAG: hypothetical protein ABDI20_06475 [Candidatus Bipolaricaulaceae bacterium]